MIIDDKFLSNESKEFIENYILTRHFPLYMQGESVVDDETPFLNHVVLARPEMKDFIEKHEHHDTFVKMLDEFCDKNNIETLFGIGGNNKSNSSSWILKKWKE